MSDVHVAGCLLAVGVALTFLVLSKAGGEILRALGADELEIER